MEVVRALADPQKRKYVIGAVSVAFVGALLLMVFTGRGVANGTVPVTVDLSYHVAGETCIDSGDCLSKVCKKGTCMSASCMDGVHNGDESDIDCGGYCRPCDTKRKCQRDMDCVSSVCGTSPGVVGGVCLAASCSDKRRNGHETDVDCGGEVCRPCAASKTCRLPRDCSTALCQNNLCLAPSCTDGLKNEDETDVDCGGISCLSCGDGKTCSSYTDCSSLVCENDVCQAASCEDEMANGDEVRQPTARFVSLPPLIVCVCVCGCGCGCVAV